jgi:hypothetical protein
VSVGLRFTPELRADSQGTGIRKDHSLCLAIVERSGALERQQGRAYRIRESPRDRGAVGILEIQQKRRSGKPGGHGKDFDRVDFGILNYIVEFDAQHAVLHQDIRALHQCGVGSSRSKNVQIGEDTVRRSVPNLKITLPERLGTRQCLALSPEGIPAAGQEAPYAAILFPHQQVLLAGDFTNGG